MENIQKSLSNREILAKDENLVFLEIWGAKKTVQGMIDTQITEV